MASTPKKALSGTPRLYDLYDRIRSILESARAGVARTVNTTQVAANWLVGREIVEEEQAGTRRAGYGAKVLANLSARLESDYGKGYSVDNLESFRQFYLPRQRLGNCRQPIPRHSGSQAVCTPAFRGATTAACCAKDGQRRGHSMKSRQSTMHGRSGSYPDRYPACCSTV